MDCGEFGPVCNVVAWSLGELAQTTAWEWLKAIAAIGGLAFGIYRWWYSAERNMHLRLHEYLQKQDDRIILARDHVLSALHRPDLSHQSFYAPLFAAQPLRKLLKRHFWADAEAVRRNELKISNELNRAVGQIEKQIEVSISLLHNYRRQLSSAHALNGAIHSASASDRWSKQFRFDDDDKALSHFRDALNVPGFSNDIVLKQLEAHQIRKLGHLPEAFAAYEAIEQTVVEFGLNKNADFIVADAKRWRSALIASAQPQFARYLLKCPPAGDTPGAIDIMQMYAPLRNWDLISFGDANYLAAFINDGLGFVQVAQECLADAERSYSALLSQTRGRHRWRVRQAASMRKAAQQGLARIESARADRTDGYDKAWLLP